MGDKITARRFAVSHDVPVTPSADEADNPATFAERARALGFPLLQHPAFARGETDTGFLERHKADLAPVPPTLAERQAMLAVAATATPDVAATRVPEPYASMGAWRN